MSDYADFIQDKGDSLLCKVDKDVSSFCFMGKKFIIKFNLLENGNYMLNLAESDLKAILDE